MDIFTDEPELQCDFCRLLSPLYYFDCGCLICFSCMPLGDEQTCPVCFQPNRKAKKLTDHSDQLSDVISEEIAHYWNIQRLMLKGRTRQADELERKIDKYQELLEKLVDHRPEMEEYFKERIDGFEMGKREEGVWRKVIRLREEKEKMEEKQNQEKDKKRAVKAMKEVEKYEKNMDQFVKKYPKTWKELIWQVKSKGCREETFEEMKRRLRDLEEQAMEKEEQKKKMMEEIKEGERRKKERKQLMERARKKEMENRGASV